MHRLEVGKPYVAGRTSWPEGVEFNWWDSGPELRAFFSGPSPTEISQFRTGLAEFGLVIADRIIFVLVKMGSLDWMDAPYHYSMVPEARRPDLTQEWGPETRALLQVCLVDAATGILKAIRMVSLSPEYSRQLHALVREQASHPMTRSEYDASVDKVYREYPATDLLKLKALLQARGGE